jgi:hypothetical protein
MNVLRALLRASGRLLAAPKPPPLWDTPPAPASHWAHAQPKSCPPYGISPAEWQDALDVAVRSALDSLAAALDAEDAANRK